MVPSLVCWHVRSGVSFLPVGAAVIIAQPKLLEHFPEQRFVPKAQDSSG